MAWPLHKVARGWLELLNARNLGRSPVTFGEQVIPTIEIGEFYASNLLLGSTGAPTVGAIAPELSEALPISALLRVKAASVSLTIGAAAATNVVLSVGYQPQAGITNAVVDLGAIYIANAAIGQILRFGVVVPNWVIPSGGIIFGRASGTAAGADHSLAVQVLIENYSSGQ